MNNGFRRCWDWREGMSNTASRIFPLAALPLALIGPAMAAELPEEDYVPPQPEAVPLAPVSNWYLRGDVAYSFTARGDGHYRGFNTDPAEFDYDEWKLRWRGDADLGLGYRFDNHFRGDATVGCCARCRGPRRLALPLPEQRTGQPFLPLQGRRQAAGLGGDGQRLLRLLPPWPLHALCRRRLGFARPTACCGLSASSNTL